MTIVSRIRTFLERPIQLHGTADSDSPGVLERILRFIGFLDQGQTVKTADSKWLKDEDAKAGEPWLKLDGIFIREQWHAWMPNLSPKEFADIMRQDLPPDLRIHIRASRFTGKVELSAQIGNKSSWYEDSLLDAYRVYYPAKKLIDHDHFYIESAAQGQGLGRIFLANSMEIYQKMGIKKISVLAASDAGAYVWARFGFTPHQEEWLDVRSEISDTLDRLKKNMDPELVKTTQMILTSKDPKAIWLIADLRTMINGQPLGRQLLAGLGWSGRLDMTDPASMDRFNAYVRTTPALANRPAPSRTADQPEPRKPSGVSP